MNFCRFPKSFCGLNQPRKIRNRSADLQTAFRRLHKIPAPFIYRKTPIMSPGLIFVQKAFSLGLFLEGLIIGRNFAFQNGLGLTIKTASTNSLWAYIREGLSSEGFPGASEIWGAYFREGLFLFFFWGGEGGIAYYRNFTVCLKTIRNTTKRQFYMF